MNLRNPLITYLSWFENQDVEWTDSIASEFFSSFNLLQKSYGLLATSREEYDKLLQENYLARESPNYIPTNEDMEAEDWVDGEKSGELKDYLTKFIELDDRHLVQSIAHALFLATEVELLDFKPVVDYEDLLRRKQTESSLLGNKEKAEEYDEQIKKELSSKVIDKKIKDSWKEFKTEQFNLLTIHNYAVADFCTN